LGTANTPFRPNAKTPPLRHPVFPCIVDTSRLHPDAASANRRRSIALRMPRNKSLGTATFAIWKPTCREWRTTFAPIVISFSRNVVNAQ
jgi:hypothetical protein